MSGDGDGSGPGTAGGPGGGMSAGRMIAAGAILLAAIALALAVRHLLRRSELLDARDLVGDNTVAVLALGIGDRGDGGTGGRTSAGFLPVLERLKKKDAGSAHPRLPVWAGWLMSGGAASAVLPGRLFLAWDGPPPGGAVARDPAGGPVIALSLSRLPEGLVSFVVGPEEGSWTTAGHTLLFTPEGASPLEVARRIEGSAGAAPADPLLDALDDALDPGADGWLILHNGSDRLERFLLASLAHRGLAGLRLDDSNVVNGRVVANGLEGVALSFRLDGPGEADFDGSARFRDAASALAGRDWLQRAIQAAAGLSGVEVKLELGATLPDDSVPLSGRAKGLERLWERMIEPKRAAAG